MSEKSKRQEPQQSPSLIPRPAVTLIALLLTGGLLGNIYLDSQSATYSGGQANYLLALLIGGVIGVDITRGLRELRKFQNTDDSSGESK